jgi:glycosyltransferase involved in cell wall biosynthesis
VEVVGEGRDRAALEAAAAGLPVFFSGFADDVPAFLRRIDLFCLPSRREALPLALMEAMAHALPCVATPVGDIREVLGDAVRTVPPDDAEQLSAALQQLILDPGARCRLGARARALAERRLDASGMVAATAEVLTTAALAGQPSTSRTAASTASGPSS